MKLSKRRLLACVMAVMLCMAAFSMPAFAEGGDYQEYEIPPEETTDPGPDPDPTIEERMEYVRKSIEEEAASKGDASASTTGAGTMDA